MAWIFDTYVEQPDEWIIIHHMAQHPESGQHFTVAFAIHSTFIAAGELDAIPNFICLVFYISSLQHVINNLPKLARILLNQTNANPGACWETIFGLLFQGRQFLRRK
jgi:hypothetical protein